MEFREIIREVEGTRRTLTLYNVDASRDALAAIERYFEPQHVSIRTLRTDPPSPANFAVLHDGDRFLAASPLQELYQQCDPVAGLHERDIDEVTIPAVMEHVDDSTFSEYGKTRMVMASREIEKRAWKRGSGTIHTGFQRLSLVGSQQHVYEKLAESGIETHVYGVPDAEVPIDGLESHGIDAPEIARSWFVVYDGDGVGAEKCALLAEETPESNTYRGFWTFHAEIVDEIRDHLRTAYLQ